LVQFINKTGHAIIKQGMEVICDEGKSKTWNSRTLQQTPPPPGALFWAVVKVCNKTCDPSWVNSALCGVGFCDSSSDCSNCSTTALVTTTVFFVSAAQRDEFGQRLMAGQTIFPPYASVLYEAASVPVSPPIPFFGGPVLPLGGSAQCTGCGYCPGTISSTQSSVSISCDCVSCGSSSSRSLAQQPKSQAVVSIVGCGVSNECCLHALMDAAQGGINFPDNSSCICPNGPVRCPTVSESGSKKGLLGLLGLLGLIPLIGAIIICIICFKPRKMAVAEESRFAVFDPVTGIEMQDQEKEKPLFMMSGPQQYEFEPLPPFDGETPQIGFWPIFPDQLPPLNASVIASSIDSDIP